MLFLTRMLVEFITAQQSEEAKSCNFSPATPDHYQRMTWDPETKHPFVNLRQHIRSYLHKIEGFKKGVAHSEHSKTGDEKSAAGWFD